MRKLIACGVAAAAMAVAAPAAFGSTYIVLYKQQAVGPNAAASVQAADGTLVASYPQIGVVIARSDSTSFRDDMLKDSQVEGAAATDAFGYRLPDEAVSSNASGPPPGDLPNAPAAEDPLAPLQWDMRQIHTPEAHAITGGSPAVLVGDIDTGADFGHPDLKPNLDVADSANCTSGAAVPGLAAQDDNGHGTHTAGTIAAASNAFGITGVAPNVRIAAIKAGNAAGYFFPEAVVCAFVWAADHHVDVTNNSYYADPWEYNCKNDPAQRAIWKAERRAIEYAQQQGTTVVAAMGNEADDLAHPTQDVGSPDDQTPEQRTIHNDCAIVPVEVPGVVGVTADGNAHQSPSGYLKAYYSNYGVGVAQVVAPGGDFYFGRSPEAPNGLVLSTWPSYEPCSRSVKEPTGDVTYPTAVYCYLQGTSMASPHVAGVAALVVSRYGRSGPPYKTLPPGKVQAILSQTADPQPCPDAFPDSFAGFNYLDVTGANSGAVQTCQGGTGNNAWYGNGQVNALDAVTHSG